MTDRTKIRRAIARLTPPHLAVIYRAHHLGQSIEQIAAETDTPECVVRATLHDAMRELRRILVDVRVAV
jgi:DNA-directed RNA polymerase specialized sigma24 family protein